MRKVYSKAGFLAILFLLCFSALPCRAVLQSQSIAANAALPHRLQRALVDLPGYSVFDYVTSRIADSQVVLLGNVLRPELKRQAEQACEQFLASLRFRMKSKSCQHRSKITPSVKNCTNTCIIVRTLRGTLSRPLPRFAFLSRMVASRSHHPTSLRTAKV
jgi:hypothetical protein